MTDSRSHGHGTPRLPLSASTPSRMPTLGSTEKVALAVTARFMRVTSMPSALPACQARTIKITQTTAINATIDPQIRYTPPLFSCSRTLIAVPSFIKILTDHTIPPVVFQIWFSGKKGMNSFRFSGIIRAV